MNKSRPSSIYGPVDSWRLGKSLGVDVLCVDSICSFECVYCQLGKINRVTLDRDIFVTTEEILEDLAETNWKDADVITFSGSGEPTLAANLGDVISKLKTKTGKPIVILTNSTLLNLPEVRSELSMADKVFCKLDAWSDDVLRRVDRPHVGIDLESIVEGICLLRDEVDGFLAIQTMLLRAPCESDIQAFADLLNRIGPDEIQLNTPTRPIPPEYFPETRGNEVEYDQGFTQLKTISKTELESIRLAVSRLVGCTVVAR